MDQIVKVQFARLAKRLELRNITISLEDSANHYLANKGYDSQYGARPLKRIIQREIENILAEKILRGEIYDGQKIIVKFTNEKLDFVDLK
jgi:ATP-dependent Clp protease ATP-binding subunit ClpB